MSLSPHELSKRIQIAFSKLYQLLQTDYLFHPSMFGKPVQIPLVKHKLTRNIASLFPAMMDEMLCAFNDEMPQSGSTSVRVLDTFMRIVCRVSNRTFIGKPMCRDSDFMDINIRYTGDVGLGIAVLSCFPRPLKW